MSGNAFFSFANVGILSVDHVDAPLVKTSAEFDAELTETYERLGLQPGILENVAGIKERRWWEVDSEGNPTVSFSDAAALAGRKTLDSAAVDPNKIGLLIDTSVCRSHLEPSAAVDIHHQLGLGSSCMNFDLSNACLGFVNGMHLAGTLIDAGQIDYALIVDGEGSREPQEKTIKKLQSPDTTVMDIFNNFATLTLGSGGAAMLLGKMDQHPEAHRLVSGTSRAATEHNKLCVGDLNSMQTDSKALLEAGTQLSIETWEEAKIFADWNDLDHYIIHQVSTVHTAKITEALNIDSAKVPLIFPTRGNIGPASIPIALSIHQDKISSGDRLACLGIGSGLNASVIEILW